MSTVANARISDPSNAAPIATSTDWRQAAIDLIAFWIQAGQCFSSGEVASALRVHRTDLRFSVPSLGEFIRDLYYGQQLPQYLDDGTAFGQPTTPFMSPRFTTGLFPDRTPAGIQVFVYGPSPAACDAHEFEVFIPNPQAGETMASAPAPSTPVPQPARGAAPTGTVFIGGSKTAMSSITAKVAADGRVYIPRAAFETAVHLGGTPLRGGDPVYVTQTADEATVTLADVPGAKVYDLWRDRGKIAFGSLDPAKPFNPGDTYQLVVEAGKITVPLT